MPNGNEWDGGPHQGREPDEERPLRWAPEEGQQEPPYSAPPPSPPPPDEPQWGRSQEPPPPPPPGGPQWGRSDEPPPPPPPPALPSWERLNEVGFLPALFSSIKEVLFEPSPTFARMPRVPELARPLLFLVLLGTVGAAFAQLYGWLQQVFASQITGIPDQQEIIRQILERLGVPADETGYADASMMGTQLCVGHACAVLLAPVFLIIFAFVWAGIVHLLLMLFGGANHGYETTFRTVCYTTGATSVFLLFPVCGQLIASIWAIVCTIIALVHTQKCSGGQAAAAVLVPVALCCCCVILFFAVLMTLGWQLWQQGAGPW